jgi:ElaB/YqjD/DUF883 family membrane-anchored ribosome-binding protein
MVMALKKQAASPAAIGAGVGAGLAGSRAVAREFRIRAEEEGKFPDARLKKARRKRLLWHLGSTATGAAAGAGAGHFGTKAFKAGYKGMKGEAAKGVEKARGEVEGVMGSAQHRVKDVMHTAKNTADDVMENARKTVSHTENAVKGTSQAVTDNVKDINRGAARRIFMRPDEYPTIGQHFKKVMGKIKARFHKTSEARFEGFLDELNGIAETLENT